MGGTLVDLFAGCGGMARGFELANYESVFVAELDIDAMSTYLRNRPGAIIQRPENQLADITELTRDHAKLERLADRFRSDYGEIDVVAGGPPCQGYSAIGHRRSFDVDRQDVPSNHLYRHMARFVEVIQPKTFVFENVRGLLTARWTKHGAKGEILDDIDETFKAIRTSSGERYEVYPKLLHAKDYGVPQNRPRLVIIGVRSDLAALEPDKEKWHPEPSQDVIPPDPVDLLSDLEDPTWMKGPLLNYPSDPQNAIQREMRTRPEGDLMEKGSPLTEQEYSRHSTAVQARFQAIRKYGVVPAQMRTKKFAQRALPERWGPSGPNITVASLPDDYVHYGWDRSLTVREWARLQGFPDWYEFSGKRTTGGRARAGDPDNGIWHRVLPKYTQIGNAVPVGLAEAIAMHLTTTFQLG